MLGYCKLGLSIFKATPQIYWNYKRKSTRGFSIAAVLLDLVGGALSFASGGLEDDHGFNITKILLGLLSVFYDGVFLVQHYCIYRGATHIIETGTSLKLPATN